MPRKLTRSSAKKTSSNLSRPAQSSAEAMERDFKRIPAELPAQYGKDISSLKQLEKQISVKLKKMQKQKKAAKNKHAALAAKSKGPLTAIAKKKIRSLKEASIQINQEVKALDGELSKIKQIRKELSLKQAKFIALSKHIAKLDRQWDAKSKPALKTKKTKKKLIQKTTSRKQKAPQLAKQPTSERAPVARDTVSFDSNLANQPETEEVQ